MVLLYGSKRNRRAAGHFQRCQPVEGEVAVPRGYEPGGAVTVPAQMGKAPQAERVLL